jgi:hypothetical protein
MPMTAVLFPRERTLPSRKENVHADLSRPERVRERPSRISGRPQQGRAPSFSARDRSCPGVPREEDGAL